MCQSRICHLAIPFLVYVLIYTQILLQVLSNVKSPEDLHSFFCTSRGVLSMAADPVLKACWLAKHRQSRAVDLAARKGGADVMIHLLRMGAVSATEKTLYIVSYGFLSFTPIKIAAREDLPEVVVFLLRRGDVRADVANITSALCRAAYLNHVECLQALLAPDSPVNANSLNACDQSPLSLAVFPANFEAVQLLLSRGAVCTVQVAHGSTLLHHVCFVSDKKAVRAQMLGMLLDSGGDSVMNAQNDEGNTPLHCAVFHDLPECCEMLLRAGAVASLSIRDRFGKTPLDAAIRDRSCQSVLARYANNG